MLIAHMGGPFWARKDAGAWSIPKGLVEGDEAPLQTALREFEEELGIAPPPVDYRLLGEFRYSSGKRITVFDAEADLDLSGFEPGTFELALRGGLVAFPEVDRVAWVDLADAREKLVKGQRQLLEALSTRP